MTKCTKKPGIVFLGTWCKARGELCQSQPRPSLTLALARLQEREGRCNGDRRHPATQAPSSPLGPRSCTSENSPHHSSHGLLDPGARPVIKSLSPGASRLSWAQWQRSCRSQGLAGGLAGLVIHLPPGVEVRPVLAGAQGEGGGCRGGGLSSHRQACAQRVRSEHESCFFYAPFPPPQPWAHLGSCSEEH